MWLTPHPHAISIDKKMSNLVTVNYNKLVTMEGVSNITVTGATTTEFTDTEYQNYDNYAKDHGIYVSLNTVLLWVTMPGVSGDSATVTVTFQKQQTYTILYQPADGANPDIVVCKIVRSVKGEEETSYMPLQRGATMGDGTAVWSMKMTASFAPTQIAFVAASKPSNDEQESALATRLSNAAPSNAAVSQNANANWTELTGNGKYLIIGGDAKVVTAAFVTDPSKMVTYKDNTINAPETTEDEIYATYQIAVITESDGNVTPGMVKAPAAPKSAPEGKAFDGWRGFKYEEVNSKATEQIYSVGDTINIRDNTIFNAVWKPAALKVSLDLGGGTGGSSVSSVTYGEKLAISENPTRSGFAFDG